MGMVDHALVRVRRFMRRGAVASRSVGVRLVPLPLCEWRCMMVFVIMREYLNI